MRYMYHATDGNNLASIMDKGLKVGYDGIVYMTEKEEDAIKFVALRNYENIITFKIKIYKRDEKNVIETFDHSEKLFNCRAFGYTEDIEAAKLSLSKLYKNPYYVKIS